MKGLTISAVLVVLASCAVIGPKFHNANFDYQGAQRSHAVPIKVPLGFVNMERADDDFGNQGVLYNYESGRFFVLYAKDTSAETMQIDMSVNQPLRHATGALVFKGMHENGNYWRLIRHPHFRVGYQQVPPGLEVIFDSASNYTARQLMQ